MSARNVYGLGRVAIPRPMLVFLDHPLIDRHMITGQLGVRVPAVKDPSRDPFRCRDGHEDRPLIAWAKPGPLPRRPRPRVRRTVTTLPTEGWRISALVEALEGVMVPGILGISRLRALLAYWEKRGELGPYPRDDHGHRRFGPEDVPAIRARIERWHADDTARSAHYRAVPREQREAGWTRLAMKRHAAREHAGAFEACDSRLCHPYTPKAAAYRAMIDTKIAQDDAAHA